MRALLIIINIVLFTTILILGFENINNYGTFYFLTNTNVSMSSMMMPLFTMAFIGFLNGIAVTLLFVTKSNSHTNVDNKQLFSGSSGGFDKNNENDW